MFRSLGSQEWLQAVGLSEASPPNSGTLPMGLAGHVCNLFLFLDTSAHAVWKTAALTEPGPFSPELF